VSFNIVHISKWLWKMHRNPLVPTAARYLIKYTLVVMPKKSTAMQVSERRWIYDVGFPGRLPRHSMTDLACTYPILNGLILNGFQTKLTLAISLCQGLYGWSKSGTEQSVYSPNIQQMYMCRAHMTNFIYVSVAAYNCEKDTLFVFTWQIFREHIRYI